MPLYTSEALILRTYKLAEADRIVVFLTRDRGKKRGVARGARRSRSPFGGALEPLTEGRVAYFEKEQRELVSLNYVEVARSPLVLVRGAGAEGLGYVGYFAELIDQWAQEGDPNERLYRLGVSMLGALAAGASVEPLARYFEYWLLRLQGVYPPHLACHRCGAEFGVGEESGAYLAPGAHTFTCQRCSPLEQAGIPRGASLSRDALGFLRLASSSGPGRVGSVPVAPRVVRELEAVHRALITTHLEREPKAARVIRDMRR